MKHIRNIASLALWLVVAACARTDEYAHVRDGPGVPVRRTSPHAALLVPLSGAHKTIGTHLKNAAQMAVFDAQSPRFQLAFYDTKGDTTAGVEAAQQARVAGANLILGPLFAQTAKAVYQRNGSVPILSFSNDASISRPGLYVLGFHVKPQMERLFGFLDQQGKHNIVLLAPQTPYGQMITQYARAHTQHTGKNVTVLSYHAPQDMTQIAAQLATLPQADTLVLAEDGQNLHLMVSSLLYHDVALENYQIARTASGEPEGDRTPALVGSWLVGPDPARRRSFESQYRALYRENPPRLATLAYDAVMLAVRAGPALHSVNGFEGLDGSIRLTPHGGVRRALAVLQVQPDGRHRVISPPQWEMDGAPPENRR